MKILCRYNALTEDMVKRFGAETSARPQFQITIGNIYEVLSVSPMSQNAVYGACSLYDVADDVGRLLTVPAYLFDIVDAAPSMYWRAFSEGAFISFSFPDLKIEFFADDLSEDVPDIVEKWEAIKLVIRSES